jgi:tetratricopeptide (TPR) repeat protein
MHKKKRYVCNVLGGLVFFILLLNGCAALTGKTSTPNPQLAEKYFQKGQWYEKTDALPKALEQYKLALTVDPGNVQAQKSKERLTERMNRLANARYYLGMKYYRQGKYELARNAFLSALKYQPDHPGASNMLAARPTDKVPEYTIHIVKKGESLSTIAKTYYGDYKKYAVIARYNNIQDVARVNPGQTIKIPILPGLSTATGDMPENTKPDGYVWHTLEPGQSISKLAQIYYGDYRQFHLIARFNGMEDAATIKAGDRIKIPRVAGLPFNVPSQQAAHDSATGQPTADETPAPSVTAGTPPGAKAIPPEAATAAEGTPADLSAAEEGTSAELDVNAQIIAYRDTGVALYKEGKYEDAIVELNKAVEAAPDDHETQKYLSKSYFASGMLLYSQKNFTAAREAFESARQYDPRCADCEAYIQKSITGPALAFRESGMDALQRSDYPTAIAQFEMYLKAQPTDADIRSQLSTAYFQNALIDYNKGAFMAAVEGFKNALTYDETCDKCKTYIAQSEESFKDEHYNRGVVYYGNQQLAEAISEWEQVYGLDPGYKEVARNLKKARDLMEKLEKIKKSQQP